MYYFFVDGFPYTAGGFSSHVMVYTFLYKEKKEGRKKAGTNRE